MCVAMFLFLPCLMIRCCGTCGKVLDQEIYTDEPTFVKDSSGQVGLAIVLLNIWFLDLSM